MNTPDARRRGMRLTAVALALTLLGGFAVADGFAAAPAEAAATDPVAPPTNFYPTVSGGAAPPPLFSNSPCPSLEQTNKALFDRLNCTVKVIGTSVVPSSLVPEVKVGNVMANCSDRESRSMGTGTSAVKYVERAVTNSSNYSNTTSFGVTVTKSWQTGFPGLGGGGSVAVSVETSNTFAVGKSISDAVQEGEWRNEDQRIPLPPYSWGYFAFQSSMSQVDLLWQWTPNPTRPDVVASDVQTINVRDAKSNSGSTANTGGAFGRVVDRIVPMNPAEIKACWESAQPAGWKPGDPYLNYDPGTGDLPARIIEEPAMLRPTNTVDLVSYPSIFSSAPVNNPITRNVDQVKRDPYVGAASTAGFRVADSSVRMWRPSFWGGVGEARTNSSLVMPPGSEVGFWTGNACSRLTAELGGSYPKHRDFEMRVKVYAVTMVNGEPTYGRQLGTDVIVPNAGTAAGESATGKVDVSIPENTEAIAIRVVRPDRRVQNLQGSWIFDGTRDTVIVSQPKIECAPPSKASNPMIKSSFTAPIQTVFANLAATPEQVQADPYLNMRPNATPVLGYAGCSTSRPDYVGYSCNGTPTTSNGTVYPAALGLHARTEVTWGLTTPSCSAFRFSVAWDDHMAGNKDRRPLTVEVRVDGTLVQTVRVTPYPDRNPLFDVDQAITRGPHTINLVVVPDNNDISAAHVNIINPRLQCQVQDPTVTTSAIPVKSPIREYVPVGGLTWANVVTWHHSTVRDIDPTTGGKLMVAGVTFPQGIGTHAFSSIDVAIPRKDCSMFMSDVGVLDSGKSGSVQFEVWGGGKRIAQSQVMRTGDAPALLQADIAGLSSITLKVTNGGDNDYWDHAAWGRPVLSCADTSKPLAPTIPTDPTAPVDPAPQPPTLVTVSAADVQWSENSFAYRPATRGTNLDTGKPVSIDRVFFKSAIAQVSGGVVRLRTGGECTQFSATIGVDDYARAARGGSLKFELVGDGVPLTSSPILYWNSKITSISANISGIQSLELRVTDGGDNINWDHAVWGDPTLTCVSGAAIITSRSTPTVQYLADLPWRTNEWTDFPSRPGQTIENVDRPVSIRGTQYEKGIGAHSYSVIRIPVSPSCETLVVDLGVDDETGGRGYVEMQVWADSTMKWWGEVSGTSDRVHLEIPIAGTREIALTTNAAGSHEWDHAAWGDPKVLCFDS